ncbi:hypothetical protein LINPERHAP1_LOCUS3311 [Linum perenne]
MAVQRQTAASRSTSPSIKLQQGLTGGFPILSLSNEPSTLPHTPNLRVSMGHFPEEGVGVGVGFGFGFDGVGGQPVGLGGGGGQPLCVAETMVKKRTLRSRKRAMAEFDLEAIVALL